MYSGPDVTLYIYIISFTKTDKNGVYGKSVVISYMKLPVKSVTSGQSLILYMKLHS